MATTSNTPTKKFTGEKYMTIQQAIDAPDKAPLWLQNVIDETNYVPEGGGGADLYFTVGSGSSVYALQVLQTWLPYEATSVAPRDIILVSTFFRQSVAKKLIHILTPDYAAYLRARPTAAIEQERLDRQRDAVMLAGVNTAEGGTAIDTFDVTGENVPDPITANFKAFVSQLNETTVTAAKNMIAGRKRFKSPQVRYMIANLQHPELVSDLQQRLAEHARSNARNNG